MKSQTSLQFNSRFWERKSRDPMLEDAPQCDWPDCQEKGLHKAPKSKKDLKNYNYYCLDHIREFNKRWNFYEGMSQAQIEQDMRKDYTWDRPSWNFGTVRKAATGQGGFKDDFGFFNEDGSFKNDPAQDDYSTFDRDQRQALATLNLTPEVDAAGLKARYKELVKKFHPDTNNGDKAAEEQFKLISEAYRILKPVILE